MTSPWTPALEARLTELWNAGVAATRIGQQMGLSKSSIVSKAGRLRLPGRPSPIIIRDKGTLTRKESRALGVAADIKPPISGLVAQPNPLSKPASPRTCQFIAGEKGVDFGLYVDAPGCPVPPRPGSSYCEAHYARCYFTPEPRRRAA